MSRSATPGSLLAARHVSPLPYQQHNAEALKRQQYTMWQYDGDE